MMGKKLQKINIVALLLFMVLLLAACGKNISEKWQEQYDLGMQYLTGGDYEAAIVAFTEAIETEPKMAALYVARGDTYLAWAEKVEANTLADVENGNFVEWDEISTEDGGYTLQELYENAQADYEEAVALLESGEAADQDDDLLEEARKKLETAKEELEAAKEKLEAANEKLQADREVLAAKLVELAEEILCGDTSDEEKTIAYQYLETAEELTEDEDVQRQIEELLSGEEGGSEPEGQSGDDGEIQLEASSSVESGQASGQSSGYQNLEDFSAEEQTVIADLVAAAVDNDLDSIYFAVEELTEVEWYIAYDDYRVRITKGRDYNGFNIGGEEWWPYIIVSVRPQNGTGYCYYIWEDADGSSNLLVGFYSYFLITDYVTCPCVNWNWDGEYTQIYNLYYDESIETGTSVGTVKNNTHDGEVNLTYDIIWDGEVESSETYTFYGDQGRSFDEEGRLIEDPRFYSWQYNGVGSNYWLSEAED